MLLTRVVDDDNGVQTNYRHTYLGSTECRISYCVDFVYSEMSSREKGDKINNDGPVQDLQVTKFSLSMCGQDAIIILRSPNTPRNLIDTPYNDILLAIQNYISPEERVVTAETFKFSSVIQGVGESDDNFLTRHREEARYCDF